MPKLVGVNKAERDLPIFPRKTYSPRVSKCSLTSLNLCRLCVWRRAYCGSRFGALRQRAILEMRANFSVCLSVCLCLSLCFSVSVSVCLYLSGCLSLSLCVFFSRLFQSVIMCFSQCPPACGFLSVCVCVSLSLSSVPHCLRLFSSLSLSLSPFQSFCPSLPVCPSISSVSVCLSVCLFLSLSLSLSLSLPPPPPPSLCVHYLKTSVVVCVCAAVCLWVAPATIAERNRRPTRSHNPRLPTYTANLNIIMTKACVPYVVPSEQKNDPTRKLGDDCMNCSRPLTQVQNRTTEAGTFASSVE